jgi:hypothetical protein
MADAETPKAGDQYLLKGTTTVFAILGTREDGDWNVAIGIPKGGVEVNVGMTKPDLSDAIGEGKLVKIPDAK